MSYGDIAGLALTLVESVGKPFQEKNSEHFFQACATVRRTSGQ
jgi:hypothetical protein